MAGNKSVAVGYTAFSCVLPNGMKLIVQCPGLGSGTDLGESVEFIIEGAGGTHRAAVRMTATSHVEHEPLTVDSQKKAPREYVTLEAVEGLPLEFSGHVFGKGRPSFIPTNLKSVTVLKRKGLESTVGGRYEEFTLGLK